MSFEEKGIATARQTSCGEGEAWSFNGFVHAIMDKAAGVENNEGREADARN